MRLMTRLAARSADRIIAVSEATKADLVEILRRAADEGRRDPRGGRPRVRARPQSPEAVDAVVGRYGLRRPYCLFVGNLEPRKNLPRLIEAFAEVRRRARRRRPARPSSSSPARAPGSTAGSSAPSRRTASPTRRRLHRLRAARGPAGALRRRDLLRLPVALRGLRAAGAGGDGRRRAGRRRARRGRSPRWRATPRSSSTPARRASWRRRSRPCSPTGRSGSGWSRAGGRARRQFEWNTVARQTLAVYERRDHRQGPRRMRLALDARKIDDFGIGTYIQGLLEAFAGDRPARGAGGLSPAGPAPAAPAAPAVGGARPLAADAGRGPYSVRELWRLALAARRDRADLYHAPHYVCPPWLPCPAVVTVHDLIHLRFPVRHRHALAPALRAGHAAAGGAPGAPADHRLRVDAPGSRRAARGPAGAGPRDPERRRRALRGRADPRGGGADARRSSGCRGPYFLFVGNPLPHKNLDRLLDAFAGLPPVLGGLVLVGIPPATAPGVDGAVRRAGPRGPRARPGPGAGARSGAALPERDRRGVPVALGGLRADGPRGDGVRRARGRRRTRGGLPEVVGDAGLLVDPTDVDALREAMYTLAGQESLRAALRARGLARARAFSWRHVAEATRRRLPGGAGAP